MVLCEKDQCKHLVVHKDSFDGREFIIGYQCEEGFTIETNEDIGFARMSPECEKYERKEE